MQVDFSVARQSFQHYAPLKLLYALIVRGATARWGRRSNSCRLFALRIDGNDAIGAVEPICLTADAGPIGILRAR